MPAPGAVTRYSVGTCDANVSKLMSEFKVPTNVKFGAFRHSRLDARKGRSTHLAAYRSTLPGLQELSLLFAGDGLSRLVAGAVRQLSLVPHSCSRQPSRFRKTYWQKSVKTKPISNGGGITLRLAQLSTEFDFTKTSQAITNGVNAAKNLKSIATDRFKPEPRPSKSHLPADQMPSGQTPRPSWQLKMLSDG